MKNKINLCHFDMVSEIYGNKLIGGFSSSFSAISESEPGGETANNCLGGNCVEGCGGYGNKIPTCSHNVAPLCGSY